MLEGKHGAGHVVISANEDLFDKVVSKKRGLEEEGLPCIHLSFCFDYR
jgi:hypothetical protein